MILSTQQLIKTLKSAREVKGLSQRALADKLGIPQSHLSKIEAGHVNVRLTSLVEIARMLDLEVMLVPRQEVSLVKGLLVSKKAARHDSDEIKAAYILDDEKAAED